MPAGIRRSFLARKKTDTVRSAGDGHRRLNKSCRIEESNNRGWPRRGTESPDRSFPSVGIAAAALAGAHFHDALHRRVIILAEQLAALLLAAG